MGLRDFFFRGSDKASFEGAEQELLDRSRKSVVKNWASGLADDIGQPSPSELNSILLLFSKDPVVYTGLTTRADGILSSGFTLEGPKTVVERDEKKLKRLGFNDEYLRQTVLMALTYRHLATEIEKSKKDVKHIYPLEITELNIKYDKHGDIDSFYQQGAERVDLPKDSVAFFAMDKLSTAVWGEVPFKSLYRTVTAKNMFESFIHDISVSNPYRDVIHTKMTDEDVGSFLSYRRDASQDPLMPFVIQYTGDKPTTEFTMARDPAELDNFINILSYLRSQMLMFLKVPPILMGLPDNSNRSNSDAQIRAMNLANESDRRLISYYFNNVLFPLIGITSTFSWNPIDKRDEREDIEIAEKLIAMGADPEVIEEYLRNAGLALPKGKKLFLPREQLQDSMVKKPDDSATRPSRQRENKNAEMKNVGTGEASSTRKEQVM